MWWLNWTIGSKGHMQVPYNGKCTELLWFWDNNNRPRLFLALVFFLSVTDVSFVCMHLSADCLRGTIFCVSIGLSLFRIYNVRFTLHSSIRGWKRIRNMNWLKKKKKTTKQQQKLYRLAVQGSLVSSWEMVHTRPIQLISSVVVFFVALIVTSRVAVYALHFFSCSFSIASTYALKRFFRGFFSSVDSLWSNRQFSTIRFFFFFFFFYYCRFLCVTFRFAFSFNFQNPSYNSLLQQIHMYTQIRHKDIPKA